MKVLNIHKRVINQPKEKVEEIFRTLSSENDKVWPTEKWPAMKFDDGLQIGSVGGHGPIRYRVEDIQPGDSVQFKFLKPTGFHGFHKFELNKISDSSTEVIHTIDMSTSGRGTILWLVGIRHLHDALIEDALDKLENNFLEKKKSTKWSYYVRFLRKQLAKRI